jgi:hypothetical protein
MCRFEPYFHQTRDVPPELLACMPFLHRGIVLRHVGRSMADTWGYHYTHYIQCTLIHDQVVKWRHSCRKMSGLLTKDNYRRGGTGASNEREPLVYVMRGWTNFGAWRLWVRIRRWWRTSLPALFSIIVEVLHFIPVFFLTDVCPATI